MTQALVRNDDVYSGGRGSADRLSGVTPRSRSVAVRARRATSTDHRTGTVTRLDSYRRGTPLVWDEQWDGGRRIVGPQHGDRVVLDEAPLVRLIRTVVIALLVAVGCLLMVWIANLRAEPVTAGPVAVSSVVSSPVSDAASSVSVGAPGGIGG